MVDVKPLKAELPKAILRVGSGMFIAGFEGKLWDESWRYKDVSYISGRLSSG